MSNSNAQEAAAAGEQDAPMAYIDQLAAAAGASVEDTEQDDDEDGEWLEEECVEDLVESDGEGNGGKSDSDDEEMYDSEDSDDGVDIDMLCAETTVPHEPAQPKELSAEAKLDLTWRLDEDESFSDWTIEIITSSDGENADEGTAISTYHVHKTTLATGRRKSDYFYRIFRSGVGRFPESNNSKSRISLSPDMATAFPDFLDYIYAPFPEASCVLSTDNVLQLRSLASYFIVQALTDATRDFIIEDMANLDRMEKYLKASVANEEQELIAHAVQICASSIREIGISSSLLYSMSPAFFLSVIRSIERPASQRQELGTLPESLLFHINNLSVSYLRHFGHLVDAQYFRTLERNLSFITSLETGRSIAIEFLKIIKEFGWEDDSAEGLSPLEEWNVRSITAYLTKFSLSEKAAGIFFNKQLDKLPKFAIEELMKRGFRSCRTCNKNIRKLKKRLICNKCNTNENDTALVPCGHMFCALCVHEASLCPRCHTPHTSTLSLKQY